MAPWQGKAFLPHQFYQRDWHARVVNAPLGRGIEWRSGMLTRSSIWRWKKRERQKLIGEAVERGRRLRGNKDQTKD